MPLQQSEATADNPRNHCPYRRMHLELVVGVPCFSVALAARLETPIEAWPHLGAPVPGRQLVSNRNQPLKDESINQVPNLGCQDRMGMGCPPPPRIGFLGHLRRRPRSGSDSRTPTLA